MQDPVQEIKARLSIEDVVAPYVQLKRAGKYLKAPCPFHQEKTPSFYVSPERQIAYCFSCQKGGDHFAFIQEIEGMNFREALEFLAEKAHVDLPKGNFQKKQGSKDEKERLWDAHQKASKFFVQKLWETPKVLEYLQQRGMEEKTLREFEVGFAPDEKDELYRKLLQEGCTREDLLEAQLVVARDSESKQIVDRFRLRLMFPIFDVQGNPIAFGGRALKKGEQPKYLNSAEYALYQKGKMLYNLHRAKQVIRNEDLAVVVEGYFDVMASHQAGVHNVVATSGTALTEEQFKLLKRYTTKVALAFDSDAAGQAALLRAVHIAQPLNLELFVVRIEGGKDAAELAKEDPKLWQKAVAQKTPYLEHFFDLFKAQNELQSSSGRRAFTDSFLDLLKGVKHPVEREFYLKKLSELVETPVELLSKYLGELEEEKVRLKPVELSSEKLSKKERMARYFLGLLLAFPQVFFELWDAWQDFSVFSRDLEKLGLVQQMHRFEGEGFQSFRDNFDQRLDDLGSPLQLSSVYKALRDHYTLHAEVQEAFYTSFEHESELKTLALQAELQNPDLNLLREEFQKVIALLYLELI